MEVEDELILNPLVQNIDSVLKNVGKRTFELFDNEYLNPSAFDDEEGMKLSKSSKCYSKYSPFMRNNKNCRDLVVSNNPTSANFGDSKIPMKLPDSTVDKVVEKIVQSTDHMEGINGQDVKMLAEKALHTALANSAISGESSVPFSHGLIPMKAPVMPKPIWHAPWKLMRVVSGHTGWVRCLAFEPANQWFATGSNDRMIKIWDLASATLKLSLTGHISTVRGLSVSPHHPYLFSCGEDKTIKCWDLEQNKAIRHYHGHLHSVYCLAQHPTIDVIMTGSRDCTVRVWDIRTKASVFTMTGHTNSVASIAAQSSRPQVISGSHDSTIRLWDLTAGKSYCTLTHHKKSVRSVILHPKLNCMCSAAPENVKEWKLPDGDLIQTLKGHNAILNAIAMNEDDVVVSGGDNGTLFFWDWKTGYNFDSKHTILQPGSLDSEAGIFAMGFDLSGSRLVVCEADKSIKIYKQDENATPETHPIKFKPGIIRANKL